LPEDWARRIKPDGRQTTSETLPNLRAVLVQEAQDEINDINIQLKRVTDTYLEQDIEREDYLEGGRTDGPEKTVEEKISDLEQRTE